MFFSLILIVLILVAFFIIKAKTFDRLSEGSQLLIVAVTSVATAAILTMQLFISGRRVLLEFTQAVEGVPVTLVWLAFFLILFASFLGMRRLGKLNLGEIRRILKEEVLPRQKSLMKDAWAKVRSVISKDR